MALNQSYTGSANPNYNINANFGAQEYYIRARDIGNSIPYFSGTPDHVDFDTFENLVRANLIFIPTQNGKKEDYIREVLKKILLPAKLVLANNDIKQVEDIVEILAKTYKRDQKYHNFTSRIKTSERFKDESLADFVRRLEVLVEKGLKAASKEFGADKQEHYKETLNYEALQVLKEFAPHSIQREFYTKKVETLDAALKIISDDMNFLLPTRQPVDRHRGQVNYYDPSRVNCQQPQAYHQPHYQQYGNYPRQGYADTDCYTSRNRGQSPGRNNINQPAGSFFPRPNTPPPEPVPAQICSGSSKTVSFQDEIRGEMKTFKNEIREEIQGFEKKFDNKLDEFKVAQDNFMEHLNQMFNKNMGGRLSRDRTPDRHRDRDRRGTSPARQQSPSRNDHLNGDHVRRNGATSSNQPTQRHSMTASNLHQH